MEDLETEAQKEEAPEAELEFSVKMSTGILYDYMLHHAYTSPVGIIGTCFGVLGLMLFASNPQVPLYLVMGLLVLFYLPVSLWRRSATLMLGNSAFKQPLDYAFNPEGFTVSQGGESGSIAWENCIRAVATRKSIFVYTGKRNASIFPRDQIPGGAGTLISLLSKYMEAKRVKIRY
ncbi:MAG: YcxB family protein [Lachnospiraceae bacterium]|nr:YcxB family protein [Lachnospiraceae bacterium]